MKNKIKIVPVILSGGSGTRLWPLSRDSLPKQYLALTDNLENTMLQLTIERLQQLKNIDNPIIICNDKHRFIVAEQLRAINITPKSILLEPIGRNTAPAITIAALRAIKDGEDPILLILASDHEIKNKEKFIQTIIAGEEYAKNNKLVTFGVIPTSPETGYGYIKTANKINPKKLEGVFIDSFIEKPCKPEAERLIKDNKCLWNSGMFLFKASVILKEIEKFYPELIPYCKESIKEESKDLDFQRIGIESFQKCSNISIDNAVMEKTDLGVVIPLDANWSDIGGWKSLWLNSKKDKNGNVIIGRSIVKNSSNNYIRSEGRLIVAQDIKNMVLVETNDAIFISEKENSSDIKETLRELSSEGFLEVKEHKKIYRPWGHYETIENDLNWKVKRIEVKPGNSLSLQLHNHRAEHWVVVSGKAEVEINDKKFLLHENQSTFVPIGSKHRLSNPSKDKLVLIEVQSGSYLGEDDIIRFEDRYGRK